MNNFVQFKSPVEWYFVPSEMNAADRITRMNSTIEDLDLDSEWLNGPPYLKEPIENWPIDRKFAERKSGVKLPMEEIRKPYRELIQETDNVTFDTRKLKAKDLVGPGSKDNYVLEILQHGYITNSWEKLLGRTSLLFKWLVSTFYN